MTLRACRKNKGIRKKHNRLNLAQNKAVYSDFTLSDLTGRLRSRMLFLLCGTLSYLFYLACLIKRLGILLPQWKHSLCNFCPDKHSFISSKPLIIGHRGTPLKAVENTLEACQTALDKLHAEAVEVDLCVTRDDRVFLWHDWDPSDLQAIVRQMGLEPKVRYRPFVPQEARWLKRVSRLTWDEFKNHYNYSRKRGRYKSCAAHIPLLEEFFSWAAARQDLKAVFLDVKVPAAEKEKAVPLVAEVTRLTDRYKPSFRIILLTAEEEVLAVMRRSAARFNYSLDVILPLLIVLDPVDYSAADRAYRLQNRYASVGRPTALDVAPWATYRQIIAYDRRQMQSGRKFPQELVAWTINKRRELKCLIKMGVNGIITDRPAVLARLTHGSTISDYFSRIFLRKK